MSQGQTGAKITDNRIVLHFVDGQRGDEDLDDNGIIVDLGGPSATTASSSGSHGGSSGGGCFISSLVGR